MQPKMRTGAMSRLHYLRTVLICVAVLSVFTMALAPQSQASVTLTDQNSTVLIDPTSQAGVYNWTVDGINNLYQQWFWYRIGSTGGQSSIDTISAPSITLSGTNGVNLSY